MPSDLAVAVIAVMVAVGLLLVERWVVVRNQNAISLRVAVTGTRGKSSLVRLIASGLSAGGWRVMAKTTGSRTAVTTPEGEELHLVRRGLATILEQKGILGLARRYGASALVVEVMSIRPESYAVELGQLLRPQVLVITNIRPDHTADLGQSPQEAAPAFARGIPPGCRVVVPEEELVSQLHDALRRRSLEVLALPREAYQTEATAFSHVAYAEWRVNIQLALGVCEAAGVSPSIALQGMIRVHPDFGALRAWRLRQGTAEWIALNAFAANDPVSTMAIYRRAEATLQWAGRPVVGVLNVRWDRGDRTAQWCRVLLDATGPKFSRLVVVGDRPGVVVRRLRRVYQDRVQALTTRLPTQLMDGLANLEPGGGILFGFGNIGGVGAALVEHWDSTGEGLCLQNFSS